MDLCTKYRPTTLKAIVGQKTAKQQLLKFLKDGNLPRQILFTGASGCGKTTMARILREKVECSTHDYLERNCADARGIEMARELRRAMSLAPVAGKTRVFLLDECHQLTKEAQTLLLKPLEDTPGHVYFLLCSTDPEKLLTTIRTRCTTIKVLALKHQEVITLVRSIAAKEKQPLSEDVAAAIADNADGSARKAVKLLEQVLGEEDEEQQLETIQQSDSKTQAIEIARALLNSRTSWPDMAKILKEINEEPEGLRRMVLGYCSSKMLNSPKESARAFLIVDTFRDHWFDSGRAGLLACCYEIVTTKK